jgi:hypothetical protein
MSATYRLAAILAADVVRYSRLNGVDEEGIGKESKARDVRTLCALAARQSHREHRALARFARHGHVATHHARELALIAAQAGATESQCKETAWAKLSEQLRRS